MYGIYTALVTPFSSDESIDWPAFARLLDLQIKAGVQGVVVCGTTGESLTLSDEERKELIVRSLRECRGTSVQVLAGTGSSETHDSIRFSRWASDQGVDGLLLATPSYSRPSQKGLQHHFERIADAVSCPVVLYNVPSRTGVSLACETLVRLSHHPRIQALKEASGGMSLTNDYIEAARSENQRLHILSGDDATFLPLLSIGAIGVISVASNLFPKPMVELYQAFKRGDLAEALRLHQFYFPLFKNLFIESNPVPIKEALAERGLSEAYVRSPLARLTNESRTRLQGALNACGLLQKRGSTNEALK